MSRLGDKPLTRRRYEADTWTDGRPVAGASLDEPFMGSVQPMRGRDRQVLPEGLRSLDGKRIYCDRGTLRTEDQHANEKADEVLISGARYTVVHVDDEHEEIPHDRVIVVRVQEGTP